MKRLYLGTLLITITVLAFAINIYRGQRKKLERELIRMKQDVNVCASDLESVLALQKKLMKEKSDMEQRMKEVRQNIDQEKEKKEGEIQSLRVRLKQLKEDFARQKEGIESHNEALNQENALLQEKSDLLESTLRELNAMYYNNMGVAYTKAQLFDNAIESYERSLEFNKQNPEAYYNLGLLFENDKKDFPKAIEYYKKYLEVIPGSEDPHQILEVIKRLAAGKSEVDVKDSRAQVLLDNLVNR